ncbi:cation diffusion facilitator CzcD-associated flavoprotein CzcO [Kribbella orskensis]|uniref:Cation diffusion facilitator CzcD-associated flavoprotein CzcO n=1 Tax=Kribbella orskensis TaxID=2512216 RepID=A0ABY2BUS1_9ACTN|nr:MULTISPECIES: NAD(P)/FAD-dependent oxidoreductase [Kribbella]TCN44480.1 cation diffusion facilitator CzcD-associated flavoprotein CzcO [Kribbella sp. VKM Ac-2500]TCO31742.1 cation diffusion facilitator CzcD-associated flavoprotein CzcO [Kribbella orskensis]
MAAAQDHQPRTDARKHRIVVIGTGFAGIGMAVRLKQAGYHDFVVLERAEDVGGTWRDNTYPGCRCDVPSHLYSFSFAPNPDWSSTFSPQPEIEAYLRKVTDRFRVRPHIRFGHAVESAHWQGDHWLIHTNQGDFTADLLLSGMGPLAEPSYPKLAGIESFEGEIFHSAQWNHDLDLSGRKVAVIGTGASAIQFVPAIQPDVEELHLFQRTPPWVMPRPDRRISGVEKAIYRRFPLVQKAVRAGIYWGRESLVLGFAKLPAIMKQGQKIAERHLQQQIRDPELRAELTPDFTLGCKRVLISDDYYPAVAQPNVEVVTDPILEVTPTGIVTEDGVKHEVDTIIYGTGFRVTDLPVMDMLHGRDGRTLREAWAHGMEAHLGTAIAGFPNFFLLIGPNTGLGHSSMVFMIESQLAYILDAIRTMDANGLREVEVRPEVQREFVDGVRASMRNTVWTRGGCTSWYLDSEGRNTTLWPTFTFRFRQLTRHFDRSQYLTR